MARVARGAGLTGPRGKLGRNIARAALAKNL
jgi:hypothetical protein